MSEQIPACGTCRFAAQVWGHQTGWLECRRHAPTVIVDPMPAVSGNGYAFPNAPGWCGDYEHTRATNPETGS